MPMRLSGSGATIGSSTNPGISINASGVVNHPGLPAFHGYRTVAWSGSGIVSGFTEAVNRGNYFNGGTGRFSVPVTGIYFFAFSSIGVSNAPADFYLAVNGNASAARYVNARPDSTNSTAYSPNSSSGGIVNLNAGDYCEMYTTGSIYSDANCWLRFYGWQIA